MYNNYTDVFIYIFFGLFSLYCLSLLNNCTCVITGLYMYMRKGLGIFLENHKNWGLNRGPLTLAISALPPELWPPGDSHPSQFSISLCMCHQNLVKDRHAILVRETNRKQCKNGSCHPYTYLALQVYSYTYLFVL